jgi:hypothetical protein
VSRTRATRTSRQFVPTSLTGLEGRIVLSATAQAAAAVQIVHLSRAEIAESNASEIPFGFDNTETLQSNLPVAEQKTITYNDGSTETESILKTPDTSADTITATETINLRDNGGTEKVVDVETFSPGRTFANGTTIPFTGTNRTYAITATLPNGSIQTETENEVISGKTTHVNITINKPNGGGVETISTVEHRHGPITVALRTIVEPDGSVEHQKTITTDHGELDSTSTTKTILRDGQVERSSSATDIIRVQPPAS